MIYNLEHNENNASLQKMANIKLETLILSALQYVGRHIQTKRRLKVSFPCERKLCEHKKNMKHLDERGCV